MTLKQCCGSSRWFARMREAEPFTSPDDLHEKAQDIWDGLAESDWLEAFGAHPKIGANSESQWSRDEQSGMTRATKNLRLTMLALNEEYERKFGFIFIVCAAGKTAEDMLALIERRLPNDRQVELKIAAAEQARIMHLRLDKLTWEFPHTS